jgi:hypothetical protein
LRARERPLRATGSVEERDAVWPGGFDPGAEKSALGERKQAAQPAKQAGKEHNGFEAWMQPEAGANQWLAAEPKSRTGRKTG